jgi:hypothetical protein
MRIPSISLLLPGALVLAACGGEPTRPPRDLTLLDPSAQATSDAVVSARELGAVRTETGVTNTLAAVRRLPAPARARAVPAAALPDAQPASTPAADSPAPAADDEDVALAAGGAGHALEPGQTVTVVPATSAGVAHRPEAGPYDEPAAVRNRRRGHDGDRCIPGRGEVMPRDPGAFPGGGSIPDGFRSRR